MNKIFSFIAILFLATTLWAGNTITYTATEKLEVCNLLEGMESFGPAIISHTFSDNTGTIVCDGEITMIGDTVFDECPNLISVNIPNSVKEIGFGAFRYSGLTDVYVNWININDLPTLEDEVFTEIADGTGLQGATLHVPEGTDCVYFDAEVWQDFGIIDAPEPKYDTSYVTITLDSLPYIYMWTPYPDKTIECFVDDEGLWIYCDTLRSVVGCDSVIYLLWLSATLPTDNMIITYTATEKLPGYNGSLDVGATTFGSAIISHTFSDNTGTIVCDGEITMIGDGAFFRNFNLTSIIIPNFVTAIGNFAFYNCTNLTSIIIPKSVITIEKFVFCYCSNLTSIEVDADNKHFKSMDGVLFTISAEKLIQYPNGKLDSEYCIPESVIIIGNDAFNRCTNLTSVVIPNSVKTIENGVFNRCFNLTSVNIPCSVISIGSHAFYSCSSLTTISIPESVKTIGYSAFEFCQGFKSIMCSAIVPPLIPTDTSAFYGCDYSIPLYVPAGSKEAYQAAPEWRKFTNIYDIISSVDSVTTTTAVIKWQKVDSAVTYTLSVIETESADTIATYEIDSVGKIIKEQRSLPHYSPQMVLDTTISTAEIFEVSITGLSSSTTYTYMLDAKNSESTIINSSVGSFTTQSETAINVIKEEKTSYYHRPINILGQPVNPKTHQGIYIQNGKKYLNIR